jgi:hypothetical protein
MTDSVEATLGMLLSVSDSLNKASDFLTLRISEVESALARYKLGVEVWVEIDRTDVGDGNPEYVWLRTLGYAKYSGKWGLLLSECELEDSENLRVLPLRESSRDARLAAVDKLPDLLKKLVQKATELADETTLKAEMAREIAAGLAQISRK